MANNIKLIFDADVSDTSVENIKNKIQKSFKSGGTDNGVQVKLDLDDKGFKTELNDIVNEIKQVQKTIEAKQVFGISEEQTKAILDSYDKQKMAQKKASQQQKSDQDKIAKQKEKDAKREAENVVKLKAKYDELKLSISGMFKDTQTPLMGDDRSRLEGQFSNLSSGEEVTTTKGMNEAILKAKELQQAIQLASNEYKTITSQSEAWARSSNAVSTKLEVVGNRLKEAKKTVKDTDVAKLSARLDEARKKYEDLMNGGDTSPKATKEMRDLNKEISKLSRDIGVAEKNNISFTKTFGSMLKKFTMWTSSATIIMQIIRLFKQMVAEVIKLDKAFTNIQMVTGYNNQQIKELRHQYTQLAKQLSTTTEEIAEGANEWLRQGMAISEVNKALEASVIMSKIAGITNAESTNLLTSAMKGYKLEAEDLLGIVDKLSAVDMAAAVSTSDLATAMSKTAASANLAGISMDKLLGYLATIQEVTQDAAESVGNSMKTILARMQNVKLGKFVDEETGDDLSDVEKVLGKFGIELRSSNKQFRDMDDVLDDVASKWKYLSSVEQSAIATTIAGIRQREKFIVLMENYDSALKLEQESLESSGTAMEKYDVYANSVDGALNRLKTTFSELAQAAIDSDLTKFSINALSAILGLISKTGGIIPALITLIGLLKVIKGFEIVKRLKGIKATMNGFSGKIGLILTAIGVVISVISAISNAKKRTEELDQEIRQKRIETVEKEQETLKENLETYKELNGVTDKTKTQTESLAKSWESLAEAANKYGVSLQTVNGEQKNFIDVANELALKQQQEWLDANETKYLEAKQSSKSRISADMLFGTVGKTTKNIDKQFRNVSYYGSSYQSSLDIFGTQEQRLETINELIKIYNSNLDDLEDKEKMIVRGLNTEVDAIKKSILFTQQYEAKIKEHGIREAVLIQKSDMEKYYSEVWTNLSDIEKKKAIDIFQGKIDAFKAAATKAGKESGFSDTDINNYVEGITSGMVGEIKSAFNLDQLSVGIKEQLALANELKKTYEDEKDELEKQAKIQDKLLSIEKARLALEEAKRKKAKIYREGVGFVYETDFSSVQSALSEYDKAVKDLEDYKEEIKFDEEINNITKLESAWEKFFNSSSEGFKKWANENADIINSLLEGVTGSEGLVDVIKQILGQFQTTTGISPTESFEQEYNAAIAKKATGATLTDEETAIISNYETRREGVEGINEALETRHSGGIVGSSDAIKTSGKLQRDEIITKLKKGEVVLTRSQAGNIADSVISNSNQNQSYTFGNLILPNVTNGKQFWSEITSIGRRSLQTVTSHVK